MKKQTISQIITLIVSLILVFAAYTYIVGDGTVFKGQMQGNTIKAKVIRVTDVKKENITGENEIVTVTFSALFLNGEYRGVTEEVKQEIDKSYAFSPREVRENDKVLIEQYDNDGVREYYFGDYVRITPLLFLLAIFCILVVVFSKMQGVKTIVSLAVTCMAVFLVLVPAILNDKNIYFWSVLCCLFMTVSTLAMISGYNKKSLCACIGCMSGVACAGIITVLTSLVLNMSGLLDEESIYLYQLYPGNPINMKAIIFAMIIVGALGAVMDVSMSISSSLYELKLKSPDITPKELMKSGFTIGRDMMGTMANTLVLAYIGSNLTCVLLLISYNANIQQVINKEKIIAEILQALAGSMGMLLTLPLTSLICALVYYRKVNTDATGKNESSAG
ncbi:MAG: YibE/F family protein [Clostridia bacterium]|nr:YibE/F family protein [Clostridia bacterium]